MFLFCLLLLVVLVAVVVIVVETDADDDDADPTLHLLACWPAVGRQPLKSGQQALSIGKAPGRRP